MFGPLAKWVAQIDRAERVPNSFRSAFHTATPSAGAGGAGVARGHAHRDRRLADVPRYQAVQANPSKEDVARLRALLEKAERPLLVVGGSCWDESAYDDLRRFAEANALPVGCAFRYQDHFDNAHPNYAGDIGIGVNPKLAHA